MILPSEIGCKDFSFAVVEKNAMIDTLTAGST